MPLFNVELTRMAETMRSAAWTAYAHTAAPTDADPTNGRTTVGGTGYENGIAVPVANIDMAANGDIAINADIAFGTADEDVGTITHVSFYRGTDPVGYVTVPSTTVNDGDTFTVNADSVQINGSTT